MTNLQLNDESPAATVTGRTSGSKRFALAGLALIGAIAAGVYLFAVRDTTVATEVIQEIPEVPSLAESRRRGGGAPAVQTDIQGTTSAAEPVCQGPSPGPTFSCHSDGWRLGPPPTPVTATGSGGSGRTDRSAGCVTEMPGPSFVCQDGLWTIAAPPGATRSQATETARPGESACASPAPGTGWVCENNTWVIPPPAVPEVPVMPVSPLPTAGPVEPDASSTPTAPGAVGTPAP